jgi:Tol biopolymer transport system component
VWTRRLLVCTLLSLLASPAAAQNFGRNKVQYESFDFQILETPHFNIYHYPAERDAAREAGRMAERWYERLSRTFDHKFRERQPIVLYASHAHFTQTTVVDAFLAEGTGGFTEHLKGRIVLPFGVGLGETDHVLGHELVHAFQRDVLKRQGRAMAALPLWFLEGMAEYVSVGVIDPNTTMWLRDAVEQKRLPRVDQLDDPQWFPYRYGQALWVFLARKYGDDVVARSLRSKAAGGALGRLTSTTRTGVKRLTEDWHTFIRATVQASNPPDAVKANPNATPIDLMEKALAQPKAVVATGRGGGRLNVGPALSPDGKELIFLSERDRYSVDLFLADAATGTVARKLIETSVDPHFESLQFIESAGAWDPDGRQFVFSAIAQGQPVLTIIDAHTGEVQHEIRLERLDQIFTPTWSPDGRQLAFAAMKGGFSDVYVLDLETRLIKNITNDKFSDLQPAWSPDGLTIAFATDRFTSSLATLGFGQHRLALYELNADAIRSLPSVPGGKNINPQWSATGSGLYFIADAGAVSNIHRLDLASGQVTKVTEISTGVSGVGALSPALTVSRASDRMAFSVYRRGAYEIQGSATPQDPPLLTAVESGIALIAPLADVPVPVAAGFPVADATDVVGTTGLLDGRDFPVKPYRQGLSFSGLAQPYLSAGGGGTGGFLRGGLALAFSDMLGSQELQTIVQVGKSVNDFAMRTAYLSRRSRWNWGLVGTQTPWFTRGTIAPLVASLDAPETLMRQSDLYRQIHRQAGALAVYPLSHARRIELSTGGENISYTRIATTNQYSSVDGRLLSQARVNTAASKDAFLVETRAAFVSDTALFGPTSPVRGERYRFAIAPTVGTISFATVTADYRRYTMPVRPVTIAARLMHTGRYGPGADDPRLLPMAFTLRDVVRGYGDLGPASRNLLLSSKMFVANVEARVPLLPFFGRLSNSVVPVEGIAFSDFGSFGGRGLGLDAPSQFTTLASVGAGVRLTAAGLVFEFAGARPFGTYARGWRLAFNVRPGF